MLNESKSTAKPSFVVIDAAERTYTHYVGSTKTIRINAGEEGPLLNARQVEEFRIDPHAFMGIDAPKEAA
jgi:hypothetical protein